jgi:hypothetical protein
MKASSYVRVAFSAFFTRCNKRGKQQAKRNAITKDGDCIQSVLENLVCPIKHGVLWPQAS